MIGCFILGGLAALGVMKMIHHRRCGGWHRGGRWAYAHHGCGPGHGGDPYGPDFDDLPTGGRPGGFPVRFVLDRLQATPTQARAIRTAIDDLTAELRGLRGEGRRTREDLAAALRRPAVDEVLFGELFARHDDALEKGRKAFIGAVARVHEVLDPEQRERLAAMVERGPRFVPPGFGW